MINYTILLITYVIGFFSMVVHEIGHFGDKIE